MVVDGDRIIVAVSGGKDSTSLAYCLKNISKWWKVNFELLAVHIETDFCNCCKRSELFNLLSSWSINYTTIKVPIMARLKPGEKMNCFWCSSQRRMELIKFAVSEGYNKIALGHHLDDIIETFFMNMIYNSTISTMPPILNFDKYPLEIIRPLCLCEENLFKNLSTEFSNKFVACTCMYGKASNRRIIREKVYNLTNGDPDIKRRIYNSMSN